MNSFHSGFLTELTKVAAPALRSHLTPQSSNVRGYSYDPKSQMLVITYKGGGTYRYKNVPPAVARSMRRSKSVGKAVNRRVKSGGYEYEKVGVKKQKSYRCKVCKAPATKGVIWADGRGIVPACDKHVGTAKGMVSDVVSVRDLTKTSSDAQRAFYASTKISPYYAKKQREKRKAAEARRMRKKAEQVMMSVEPHEPLPEETPVSARVLENLTLQAKSLPEESTATQADLVMDKMSQRRRQVAKLAGAAKKQVTWNGLTMKLEHEKGDVRSGVNGATGKKWSRKMRDGYGYIPGTYGKGADGEAIDVYLNPARKGDEDEVYKVRQKKKSGDYDEDKFMVGYSAAADARKAFLRNMPSWAFDSMSSMSMRSFQTLVGQDQKKRVAS